MGRRWVGLTDFFLTKAFSLVLMLLRKFNIIYTPKIGYRVPKHNERGSPEGCGEWATFERPRDLPMVIYLPESDDQARDPRKAGARERPPSEPLAGRGGFSRETQGRNERAKRERGAAVPA